ncbi:hypothetical protein ABFT23_17935 [Nocardioides sp. C4-1]|uniref:hypothetical protein n=1 Tax=Nocardioides sp. C4-1 TaxID=3151851 RepID=UPI00326663D3
MRPIPVVIAVLSCVGLFSVLQLLLTLDSESSACELTPPGFFQQTLVKKERHLLWYDCVLDPGNGGPRYTIHRPWQSVKNADGDDPAYRP